MTDLKIAAAIIAMGAVALGVVITVAVSHFAGKEALPMRFVDCQRCGAVVAEDRWKNHLAEHASGQLKTLSVEECLQVNAAARETLAAARRN